MSTQDPLACGRRYAPAAALRAFCAPAEMLKEKKKKVFFDLVFFHVRDRGLDRSARQDGFVFEKKRL